MKHPRTIIRALRDLKPCDCVLDVGDINILDATTDGPVLASDAAAVTWLRRMLSPSHPCCVLPIGGEG